MEDASFGYEALDSLSTRFKVHLEKAEVDCSVLQGEWDDMVDYAISQSCPGRVPSCVVEALQCS